LEGDIASQEGASRTLTARMIAPRGRGYQKRPSPEEGMNGGQEPRLNRTRSGASRKGVEPARKKIIR